MTCVADVWTPELRLSYRCMNKNTGLVKGLRTARRNKWLRRTRMRARISEITGTKPEVKSRRLGRGVKEDGDRYDSTGRV